MVPLKKKTKQKKTVPGYSDHTMIELLTTLYQILCIWLLGCLLALYGSTMHPARLCGGFWTIFFCLVCGPLEKKNKTKKNCAWIFRSYYDRVHHLDLTFAFRMNQYALRRSKNPMVSGEACRYSACAHC